MVDKKLSLIAIIISAVFTCALLVISIWYYYLKNNTFIFIAIIVNSIASLITLVCLILEIKRQKRSKKIDNVNNVNEE